MKIHRDAIVHGIPPHKVLQAPASVVPKAFDAIELSLASKRLLAIDQQSAPPPEPVTLVILGASGDLTQRKLVPALQRLADQGLLSPETPIVGAARSHLSDVDFQ